MGRSQNISDNNNQFNEETNLTKSQRSWNFNT